jgi:hypothetical protein
MQNNSRNKASKRGGGKQGAASKNNRAISQMFKDLDIQQSIGLEAELPKNIHIARVTRRLGNARVEVIYAKKEEENITTKDGEVLEDKKRYQIELGQASIRGAFRGKGKRAVWIDVNSIVVIEDSGLKVIEIIALMTRDQLKDLSKEIFVHPQILSEQAAADDANDGIEFERDDAFSDKEIDNI